MKEAHTESVCGVVAEGAGLEPQGPVESLALLPIIIVTTDSLPLSQSSHLSNGTTVSPTLQGCCENYPVNNKCLINTSYYYYQVV